MRASLLARSDDSATLSDLYRELSAADGGKPDPARRMLLGRMAEFLKRPAEAVDWYRGVPGGPERAEARIRMAAALYELGRADDAFAEAHALQNDAGSDDEARRNAYLLEGELRQRSDNIEGEIEALSRGLAGLSRRRRPAVCACAGLSGRTGSTAPRPICARCWSPTRKTWPPSMRSAIPLADRTQRYQGGAGADRSRPYRRAGQCGHRRQLRLGAVPAGTRRGGAGRAAPGLGG